MSSVCQEIVNEFKLFCPVYMLTFFFQCEALYSHNSVGITPCSIPVLTMMMEAILHMFLDLPCSSICSTDPGLSIDLRLIKQERDEAARCLAVKCSIETAVLKHSKAFANKCRNLLPTTSVEILAKLDYLEGLACWFDSKFVDAEIHFQNSFLKSRVIFSICFCSCFFEISHFL